jgi:hypothetical protein
MSTTQFRVARYAFSAAAMVALFNTAPTAIEAQAPSVYFACYVPLTGTVYRIKEGNLKTACTTGHVEFSWTDGANAVRTTDPAGGDLSGVFSNATVVRLLGRALATTPPQPGQVLSWNGSVWEPTTMSSGAGGGITGRELVSTTILFPGASAVPRTLTCPAGKVAVGGGYSGLIIDAPAFPGFFSPFNPDPAPTSAPDPNEPRNWKFGILPILGSGFTWSITLFVVCVTGS